MAIRNWFDDKRLNMDRWFNEFMESPKNELSWDDIEPNFDIIDKRVLKSYDIDEIHKFFYNVWDNPTMFGIGTDNRRCCAPAFSVDGGAIKNTLLLVRSKKESSKLGRFFIFYLD